MTKILNSEQYEKSLRSANEAYIPSNMVSVEYELEKLREKVCDCTKRILKTNGFVGEKPLVINGNKNGITSVVLDNNDILVTVDGKSERTYFEDLQKDTMFNLYKDVCDTIREIPGDKITSNEDFVKNHTLANTLFHDIYGDMDRPTYKEQMDAVKKLYMDGEITDIEYDYIVSNWDDLGAFRM